MCRITAGDKQPSQEKLHIKRKRTPRIHRHEQKAAVAPSMANYQRQMSTTNAAATRLWKAKRQNQASSATNNKTTPRLKVQRHKAIRQTYSKTHWHPTWSCAHTAKAITPALASKLWRTNEGEVKTSCGMNSQKLTQHDAQDLNWKRPSKVCTSAHYHVNEKWYHKVETTY